MLSYTVGAAHKIELPRFLFSVSTMRNANANFPCSAHDTATDDIDYAELSTHAADYAGKRVLFLVRHPVDTAVSWYYHKVFRAQDWEGDINTFVEDPNWGVRKIVQFYNSWYADRKQPAAFMPIAYEQLKRRGTATLRTALTFLGLDAADYIKHSRNAVRRATFSKMQALERDRDVRLAVDKLRARHVQDPTDIRSFKVREGRIGGGREQLKPSTYRRCVRWMNEMNCAYYVDKDAWIN